MKRENGYWIDDNSNKWNCNLYTEEQADKFSKTLIDCKNCTNCRSCSYCSYCSDCSYCNYCSDCRSCSDCNYCSYCSYCNYCNYCKNFKSNPQRFVSSKIGSRNSQTTFYWNKDLNQIVCGCFRKDLNAFKEKVNTVYSNKRTKYRKQYKKFIKICEYLIAQS